MPSKARPCGDRLLCRSHTRPISWDLRAREFDGMQPPSHEVGPGGVFLGDQIGEQIRAADGLEGYVHAAERSFERERPDGIGGEERVGGVTAPEAPAAILVLEIEQPFDAGLDHLVQDASSMRLTPSTAAPPPAFSLAECGTPPAPRSFMALRTTRLGRKLERVCSVQP